MNFTTEQERKIVEYVKSLMQEDQPRYFDLPEFVVVPRGRFLYGDDLREMHLDAFLIGKYPITNAQYAAFVRSAGHDVPKHWEDDGGPPPGKEDHPVVNVSWHDASAYCRWLSEVTGLHVRLPTEVEWEKAARGTDGRIYPWGDQWDVGRCNSSEGGKGDTTPVGAYPRGVSPYGALDMVGNVWEWTGSLYGDYPYDPEDGREDSGAEGTRVVRGGSWYHSQRFVRCAYRFRYGPDYPDYLIGVRVVVVSP